MSCSVKFADSAGSHDANIVVREMGKCFYAVNLGFLKHNHKYQICFFVPDGFGDRELEFDPLQSLNVVVDAIEATQSSSTVEEPESGHKFKITLTAAKEKLMRETLTFSVTPSSTNPESPVDSDRILKLQINARVLGKDKGTPALKAGVKSIGVDLDDESEQSDWQGFDS